MEKYILKNYRTRPFAQKTFEGQSDYYIVADLAYVDNPSKIIDVVAYFGSEEEETVRKTEEMKTKLPEMFYKPFYGEYVDVPQDTQLLRHYTYDDAYLGRCKEDEVGKFVCNTDGSYRLFKSIRVFCKFSTAFVNTQINPKLKDFSFPNISKYLPGWEPEKLARYKRNYCYVEILK